MSGAVFLSYAREDTAAAQRIAEALRSHGIEVWFDQSELRGGDAWDQKIRRQIGECAIFLPIISQHTQERGKGYFRLEWKLAVDQSHLLAEGIPFLAPVVVDETPEAGALVPADFLRVQWTRLPGALPTPHFVERVKHLLATSRPDEGVASPVRPAAAISAPRKPGLPGWARPLTAAALVILAGAGLFLWSPWRRGDSRRPEQTATASGEFPRNPDLERAMKLINGTDAIPEDFTLAEDIINGVLAQHPADAEAVTVMALTEDAFLYRGFDRTQLRFVTARKFAEQAVKLAPDSAAALGALGVYVFTQGGDRQRAQDLLEQAIALDPHNPFYYRFRDDVLFNDPGISSVEAIASAERTVALFPRDALSHYELSRHYRDLGRLDDMERELDRTIAIEPIVNAIIWKARVALWVRGDPEEMRMLLDRVPTRGRSLERWAIGMWIYAMATGNAQAGLKAIESLPESWMRDFDFIGPCALLEAALLDLQGKSELARLRYEAAFTAVKAQEASDPGNPLNVCLESWCLHGLGRTDEAKAKLDQYNQTLSRPYREGFGQSWWFTAIPINLILGNRTVALQLLREATTAPPPGSGSITLQTDNDVTRSGFTTDYYRQILTYALRADPRVAPWRNDPEVQAILAQHSPSQPFGRN
jgi:tetratricopeptide (TPR) repeat protein